MRQSMKYAIMLILLAVGTINVKAAGKVETIASNGTVTATVNGNTCTLTVKPDDGYYITKYDIVITKMLDASMAGARTRGTGPNISDTITPQGDEPSNLSDERTYTFELAGEEFDYKVEATFREKKIEVKDIETTSADGDKETPPVTLEISVNENNEVKQKEVTVIDEATGQEVTKTVTVIEVTLDNINMTETTGDSEIQQEIAITIPSVISSSDGSTVFEVTEIGTGVLSNLDPSVTVKEVVLPQTEGALAIAPNAFKVDDLPASDSNHQVVTIVSPLPLLAQYSLNNELKEQVDAGKLKSTVKAPNKYWTFSCGVDVKIPYKIMVYKCVIEDSKVKITMIDEDKLMIGEDRILLANNGVLVACPDDDEVNAYDIVANPKDGDVISPDKNAKSYGENWLEPVIEKTNYKSDKDYTYYVLKNNEFHPILDNDSKTNVGKAILKVPTGVSAARVFRIDGDDDVKTTISRVTVEKTDGAEWYNINGQRINKPTTKGVYIKNGKKVVIK